MRLIVHLTSDAVRAKRFWRRNGGAYIDLAVRKIVSGDGRVLRGRLREMLEELKAERVVLSAIPLGDMDYPMMASRIILRLEDVVEELHLFTPSLDDYSSQIRQLASEVLEEHYMSLEEAVEYGREKGLDEDEARLLVGLTYLEAENAVRKAESGVSLLEAVSRVKRQRLKDYGAEEVRPPECRIFKDVVEFLSEKITPRIRILLTGMTGSGKTYLARHLATHFHGPAFMLSASELAKKSSGKLGAVYDLTRELLETIESMAPAYLILNEFEAASFGETGYKLLTWLESEKSREIALMATTVNIFDLDPQILRPGRFDLIILLPMPDEEERITLAEQEAERLRYSMDEVARLKWKASEMSGATPAEIIDMVRKHGNVEWKINREERFREYMKYASYVNRLPNGVVFRQHRPTATLGRRTLRGL